VLGSIVHLKLRAEGRKSRQVVLDYLADAMTSPSNPMDAKQLNEFKATLIYFPETQEVLDVVQRRYDKPDLYRTILLGTAVECLNRLLA